MIFSVFDQNARVYDYFEATGTSADYGSRGTKYRPLNAPPQGPLASSMSGMNGARIQAPPGERVAIGFAPEALALPLPKNARKVGRGSKARGVIAVPMPTKSADPWYDEGGRSASVHGLAGLGEERSDQPATAPAAVVVTTETPFGKVIAAACIASVVGVFVQKVLK